MNNTGEPQIVNVEGANRWQIYYRLKDLEIDCKCQTNQPLRVYSDSPQAAIQVWSVTKQFTGSRQELIDWLGRCWEIKAFR